MTSVRIHAYLDRLGAGSRHGSKPHPPTTSPEACGVRGLDSWAPNGAGAIIERHHFTGADRQATRQREPASLVSSTRLTSLETTDVQCETSLPGDPRQLTGAGMNEPDWTSVVSAIVGVAGLLLAACQTWAARRTKRNADVRIAELKGDLSSALAQVRAAADSTDAMVQRVKSGASSDEVLNLARVSRGQLKALAAQLARRLKSRDLWAPGQALMSMPPKVGD